MSATNNCGPPCWALARNLPIPSVVCRAFRGISEGNRSGIRITLRKPWGTLDPLPARHFSFGFGGVFFCAVWTRLRPYLKRSKILVRLVTGARRVRALSSALTRPWGARSYLASHAVRKLQIGSGATILDGWLCTDFEPVHRRVLYMDARRRFPFADSTFDYIFTEHMIEHVSHLDGLAMLRECHRVLKSGGVIRIATPDLAVLLGLYTPMPDERQRAYMEWIRDRYIKRGLPGPAHVINNAFRSWGHQFLYDGDVLQSVMREAGFRDIRRCRHSHSDDPKLCGLESHGRSVGNEEMNVFETMVFEGICDK